MKNINRKTVKLIDEINGIFSVDYSKFSYDINRMR